MIQELNYTDAALPPELKCQILSFMRVQWYGGFSGANRLRDWITPADRHPLHLVLTEDNTLISYTGVVWQYLEHADRTFKAYGLSGVFTYPAFRGKGYGSRIVQRATDYIRAGDADIAILFCESARKNFYAHRGWIPIESAATLNGKDRKPIENELRMMLFISDHGKQRRAAFETEPLYLEDTW